MKYKYYNEMVLPEVVISYLQEAIDKVKLNNRFKLLQLHYEFFSYDNSTEWYQKYSILLNEIKNS